MIYPDNPRHCDDYIDDPTSPEPLRTYLSRARQPAHGYYSGDGKPDTRPFPTLFASLGKTRVKVVMASRLGDVGVTTRLDDVAYERRVWVEMMTAFSETP
jgi:hypothetical protein